MPCLPLFTTHKSYHPNAISVSTRSQPNRLSYRHLHRNPLMRLIPLNHKILHLPPINTPTLLPTNPPPPNHKTRLPPRRHSRTPLVHLRQHILPTALRSRHQDLGWQWLTRVPRQEWSVTSRSRRSRTSLWFPMAAFRRRIYRREDRLHRQRSRSIS